MLATILVLILAVFALPGCQEKEPPAPTAEEAAKQPPLEPPTDPESNQNATLPD